ncbi:uncharacterized protein LOC106169547 isoform X1 [Lingula anatina]|uniref:Uncharacterized protein LOC106169547 isoform X1 n=1 Tax=Lingula anatina TaxID=7574 RepID=A0A1S3J3P6_LINAN|nr:uncharacterized protein LOC106169547 isoform X1 [Lingula anatina]|eukprot:XP_013404489.1 uncharacterized protein LOC106169547 isoform X1 [Lingula anatina]
MQGVTTGKSFQDEPESTPLLGTTEARDTRENSPQREQSPQQPPTTSSSSAACKSTSSMTIPVSSPSSQSQFDDATQVPRPQIVIDRYASRDDMGGNVAVESRLDDLSRQLTRLEGKMAADISMILDILRSQSASGIISAPPGYPEYITDSSNTGQGSDLHASQGHPGYLTDSSKSTEQSQKSGAGDIKSATDLDYTVDQGHSRMQTHGGQGHASQGHISSLSSDEHLDSDSHSNVQGQGQDLLDNSAIQGTSALSAGSLEKKQTGSSDESKTPIDLLAGVSEVAAPQPYQHVTGSSPTSPSDSQSVISSDIPTPLGQEDSLEEDRDGTFKPRRQKST